MHLTNYSVNKKSSTFVKNDDGENGSKWSLITLKNKLREMNIDVNDIFKQINDIIIKTCIAVEPYMLNSINRSAEHRNNCFELYGFDVLIDQYLKVWLLEVNVCPSLSSTSALDKKIKTSLVCDILNIVGFYGYDKKHFKRE